MMDTAQKRRNPAQGPGFNRKHRLGRRINSTTLALLCGSDARLQFIDAMHAAGIVPADHEAIVGDGGIHRFRVEGDKPGSRNGWCILHLDGTPAGVFGSWRGGKCGTWRSGRGATAPAQRERFRVEIEQAKRQRQAEVAQHHRQAQVRARKLWAEAASPVDHPYLVRKKIEAHGIRQLDGKLVVPMRDGDGVLWNVQTITSDGTKRFLFGGRKRGLYFAIGGHVDNDLLIAEGYATAASLHESTGLPVAVAFDCGNLEPVARVLHAKFQAATITLCADNDVNTGGNPGLTKARSAARAVGGRVAIPPAGCNDFNDAAGGGAMNVTAIKDAVQNATRPAVEAVDSEGKPRKQSDVLVDIGKTHTLFRDTDGTPYARVEACDHHEVHKIDSTAYREVLAGAFLRVAGRGCNRNAITDATTTLSALARFGNDTRKVWLRTAAVDDAVILDMGGTDWRCIEIDAGGWHWCKTPPMFRRAGAQLSLPEPKEPDFGRLWDHVNITGEHKPLVAGFLLAALRPSGPYPQLHLSGEQGSGKSTIARMLKALVDPSASALRAPPKDTRDLLVGALNCWCLALDNLSFLTPQLSDALCRLATGGAISERALYTNTDEVLVEVQRPVILNGIEDLAIRPDLAERAIPVECGTITRRRSEKDLWAAFNADKPHIFGALLAAVARAIRDHEKIDVGPLPRMADFAKWVAAGVPELGFTAGAFMAAYRENIEVGQSAGIESSPVGRAVLNFMGNRIDWNGTAADLQAVLGQCVDESTLRSHAWPKSPRGLSGAVRRLAPALRLAGISIATSRQADGRLLTLCNTGKQPSQPSFRSPVNDGHDGQNPTLHDEAWPWPDSKTALAVEYVDHGGDADGNRLIATTLSRGPTP